MAATALAEENEVSACLNPSRLSCNKRLPVDVVKSAASINALQSKEMDGYHPVKVRKPYTITKQREKWTGEEHEKFVEALKLYGRSWRQIQEHIGTKTAVQIRSHAQKFFSKVEREPGASNAIEIPPPRPKRKPLHPYPRKYNSSTAANPTMKQPICVPLSSSSSCNQENGSPVSVLSAVQSDTFGLSISNPSTGCTSSVSSDGKDEMPPLVTDQEADEENVPPQTTMEDQFREELDQDKGLPEDNSLVEAQETSVKLFGRMVVIPDPRKTRSSAGGDENHEYYSQSSNQDILQASSVQDLPAYTVPSEWFATQSSSPFHFSESLDAKIAPLHIWWPLFPLPISHKCGLNTEVDRTQMDPLGESEGNAQASPKSCRVVESLEKIQLQKSAPYFELKPSASSAFVRGKPSSKDQSVRGFVPYKRCKIEYKSAAN